MHLYDVIGKNYDISRKADPQIARRLYHHLQIRDRSPVLDVACGTGNYTVALSELGLTMTGADIAEEMLAQARRKSDTIRWDQADANRLPYPDGSFAGAVCTLAIHHFDRLLRPFQQVFRVIDKGRFVLFTSSPEQMARYWLNEYFPQMMLDSCRQMPDASQVAGSLKQAGFRIVGMETFLIQPDLHDFFLYSGKYEPAMYLNPNVRAGISSFARLAAPEEIHAGCAKLKTDIESGRIRDVLARYSSDLGDYMFVVAEKR